MLKVSTGIAVTIAVATSEDQKELLLKKWCVCLHSKLAQAFFFLGLGVQKFKTKLAGTKAIFGCKFRT